MSMTMTDDSWGESSEMSCTDTILGFHK
jgi:hypothetical protein